MKRFWAIFLFLLMILTLLPAVAITASAETIDIAAAKVATSGTSVTVGGWVVYRYGAADTVDTYVLEDYSGTDSSINALLVYAGATAGSTFLSANSLSVGDYVEVTGTVGAFGTVPQLTSPTITAATAPTGKTCPAAQVMTFAQLAANAAEYVCELVCIEGVTLGTYAASGNTTMTDSTGSLSAYKAASYADGLAAGNVVTLYASYGLYSTTYQLRVGYRATAGDAYIKSTASCTVHFSVPAGLTAIADMTSVDGAAITLPTADAVAGYTFAGWMVQDASFTTTTTAPTLYTGSYTPSANITLAAVYSLTVDNPMQYALLTDVSGLTAGAKVLLVSTNTASDVTTYYALGTTQNGNNRSAVAVPTPVDDVITLTGSEGASSLEVGMGVTTATAYTFKDGSGYLYAASSGSNYLRSQTTLDANGEWAITLADNVATILAQGTNTRKDLRFNINSSGSPLFSAYASASTLPKCSIYVCQGSISYTVNPTGVTTYTLTYDANTTGTVSNLPAAVSGIEANASVTLSATEPTRTGYTFGGWNTAADQNGDTYAAGASFTVTEDVTLYAIWTINSYAVTWTEPENGAITAALEDGTPVNNGDLVDHFTKINVTVTPAEGYVTDTFTINGYSFTSPKNWTVSSAVTIVATFRAAETFTVSFSVPTGLTAIADMTATEGTSITLPTADAVEGYAFAGWMVQDAAFADTTVTPTLYTGSYAPTGNITLAAVYSLAVGDPMQYALLTDVNNLTAGLHVLLVGSRTADDVTTYYALGTTQNGNNRSAVVVPTPVDDVITLTGSEGASSLEVGMGVTTATAYTFKDGSGYLYAASSTDNYLRSETTLDANGEWAINLDANYVATILAQGANSRNDLRFNYNNGSPIFSAYSSTSTSTTIFKGSIYVSQGSITYTTAPVIPVTGWTVNFVANGATVYSYTVNDGETLATIPAVPAGAASYYAYWDVDLKNVAITKDYTVTASYRLWGDVHLDNAVTITDISKLQRYIVGLEELDAIALAVSDVNEDGGISVADVSLIQKYILNLGTLPVPVG